jgi:hypothetical protein
MLLASIAVLAVGAAPLLAKKGGGPPTAPGKYTDWNDEIDRLEVVESFHLADYKSIVVTQLDATDVQLPSESDNSYTAVKQVLGDTASPIVEGIREAESKKKVAAEVGAADASTAGTLLLRGKVLEMDPGSRAARYWGGFGAGAARTKIEGEVVDAATGKVLLRFTQERRSGVGIGGGGYPQLLNRNLRQLGEDVALILSAF